MQHPVVHRFVLEATNLLEFLLPGELNEMKAISLLCCVTC